MVARPLVALRMRASPLKLRDPKGGVTGPKGGPQRGGALKGGAQGWGPGAPGREAHAGFQAGAEGKVDDSKHQMPFVFPKAGPAKPFSTRKPAGP
eukprot:5100233-Pyramimonas_sp.AAC.1